MLNEEKKLQLDGIVNQAIANNETEETIQAIVNDFKSINEESKELSFSPVSKGETPFKVPTPGFISRAGEAFTEERQKGQAEGAEVSRELQEGEIGVGTALAGQAASAKQEFFSPAVKAIGSVTGEVVSPIVNKALQGLGKITDFTVGEEDKQAVSDLFSSISQAAKDKKESLPPSVQRNIESAIELGKLPIEIAELLGFGAVSKIGKDVVEKGVNSAIEKTGEGIRQTGEFVEKKIIDTSPVRTVRDLYRGSVSPSQRTVRSNLNKAFTPLQKVKNGRVVRPQEKINKQWDIITQDFVDNSVKPKDMKEFKDEMVKGQERIYDDFINPALDASPVKISMGSIADNVEGRVSPRARILAPAQYNQVEGILDRLRSPELDNVGMKELESWKQEINALTDWNAQGTDKVFNNILKDLSGEIGKMQDEVFEGLNIRGLKQKYGAYSDMLGDVNKAIIKYERKTPEGLFSGIGKIAGIGNIVEGIIKREIGTVGKGIAQGLGATFINSLNDANKIVKKTFKNLYRKPSKEVIDLEDVIGRQIKITEDLKLKKITEEKALKLLDLEIDKKRAEVKKLQESEALLSVKNLEEGAETGEGFTVRDAIDNSTSLGDQAKVSFMRGVNDKMKDMELDPEDARSLAIVFEENGFTSMSNKLNKYADDVDVQIEKSINDVKFDRTAAEDLAKDYSPRIKRMNAIDVDQIKDPEFRRELEESADSLGITGDELFNMAKDYTKPTRQGRFTGTRGAIGKDVNQPLSKPATAQTKLIEEAKKFNSADEFIKSRGSPVFHGTPKNFDSISSKYASVGNRGAKIYLTESSDAAKYFGDLNRKDLDNKLYKEFVKKQLSLGINKKDIPDDIVTGSKTYIKDIYIDDLSKIKELDKYPSNPNDADKLSNQLIKEGYDGAKFPESLLDSVEGVDLGNAYIDGKPANTILIFNEKALKTKEQLKDIFNQAKSSQ